MSEDKENAVKAMPQSTEVVAAPEQKSEGTEQEAVIGRLLDETKRLELERESYRKAALKAKGKLPDEEPDLDALIDQKVTEKLLNTQWAENQSKLESEAKRLARENKELKLAVANRSSTSPTGQVSGTVEYVAPDKTLSPEQIAHFKNTLKWDDKKIERYKKNLRDAKGSA